MKFFGAALFHLVAIVGACALAPVARADSPGQAGVPSRSISLTATQREEKIAALVRAVQEAFESRVWTDAESAIQEMATIDPIHPRIFIQGTLLRERRGSPPTTAILFDTLGLKARPGRIYADGIQRAIEKNYSAALDLLQAALGEYRRRRHDAGQAACHTALGNVHRRLGHPDQAEREYEAARPHLDAVADRLGTADLLSNLAKLERERGRPAEAAARQREILAIRMALDDDEGQGRSLRELGACLLESGDTAGALEALGRALALRRRRGDHLGAANDLIALADAQRRSGDSAQALSLLEEARAEAVAAANPAVEADVLFQIGETDLRRGVPQEALESFERSAAMRDSLGDKRGAAVSRSWAGTSLNRLGRFGSARNVLERVRLEAVRQGNRQIEAAALTELAISLMASGDLVGVLDSQERALSLNLEQKNRADALTNQNNLAGAWLALGEAGRARRHIEAALGMALDLGDKDGTARARRNFGIILAEEGRLDEAARSLQEAATDWERLGQAERQAEAWASLATVEARQGHIDAARQRLAAASRVLERGTDRSARAWVLNERGALERAGGAWDQARRLHAAALELAVSSGIPQEEWRARCGLAEALSGLGRRDEALVQARAAMERVERTRRRIAAPDLRMRFLADRMDAYETALAIVLVDTGTAMSQRTRSAEAFEIAERARARSLLERLQDADAARPADAEKTRRRDDAIDAAGEALVRLAGAADGPERNGARQALDTAEETLWRLDREHPATTRGATARTAEVQAILRDQEILLEYQLGARKSWLFAVTRDGVSTHALPPLPAIRERVTAFLDRIATPAAGLDDGRSGHEAAVALSRLVLPEDGVRRILKKHPDARLLIVPDGPLHQVPFEALPFDGTLLVESHETAILPSASTLRSLRASAAPSGAHGLLAIGSPSGAAGGPAPAASGQPSLPSAAREVARIDTLFPPGEGASLVGDAATAEAIGHALLARPRYLHFATHGFVDPVDPRFSGLRIGPSDALLTIPVIREFDLSAEVVALSACESGRGELLQGEGVIGLSRAFLEAGARSVVASLWRVGDESTADFMESFYRHMLGGKTAAGALRTAKLEFLRSDRPVRRQTYRWAPFILVGPPEAGGPPPKTTAPRTKG